MQKHYPITVCGARGAATVDVCWSTAIIRLKFTFRKGQSINIGVMKTLTAKHLGTYISETPNWRKYGIVEFSVPTHAFLNERDAISFCEACITHITKHINFDADENLVTKELLIALS